MSGTGSALAEIIDGGPRRPSGPPPATDMTAILAAAQHQAGPPLRIRRHESDEGPAYWRWDCANCGEYGGGRHHTDAVSRAMRDHRLAVHPMLFALDDDPGPPPLAV